MKYKFENDLEKNQLSMAVVDARRFGKAVEEAIHGLELEIRCYGLQEEPYVLETMAFLERMANRLTFKDKAYYVEKAKRQRGLTDEQIDFFLQNHSRWDLLPYYACYVKKLGMQGALEEVRAQFG